MVMSVTISLEGRVCVAHDVAFEGMPISLQFDARSKALVLILEDGTERQSGAATMPAIGQRLQQARQILLKQLQRPSEESNIELPLHILFQDDDLPVM